MPRGRKRRREFIPVPWIANSSSEDEHHDVEQLHLHFDHEGKIEPAFTIFYYNYFYFSIFYYNYIYLIFFFKFDSALLNFLLQFFFQFWFNNLGLQMLNLQAMIFHMAAVEAFIRISTLVDLYQAMMMLMTCNI